MPAKPVNRIFCAFDTPDLGRALDLAGGLKGAIGGIKLGLEFYAAHGPAGVEKIAAAGLPVFLDLKLHDIPNTVAKSVSQLVALKPKMLTIHAQGGLAMMRAAAEAAGGAGGEKPLLLGVTVLTSLDAGDLNTVGVSASAADQVKRLAELALKAGLEGVVCSPMEISALRDAFGNDLTLVVPGIRPEGADKGDQKRVMTPKLAVDAGADYLVIGRPITDAADPAAAARDIAASLSG